MHQNIAALRSLRLFPITRTCVSPFRRALSANPFGTAVHSEDPQGEDAEEAAKSTIAEEEQKQRSSAEGKEMTHPPTKEKMTAKSPPFASSPRLESWGVVRPPANPTFQQKRRTHVAAKELDAVACVGWDGAPLRGGEWGTREEEEIEKECREYYEGHKPSPLSEVKFVDTRKPITRATDGGAEDLVSGEVAGLMLEDTVDAALLRAERMFREAAVRGDPDSPQARALARIQSQRGTVNAFM